MTQVFSLVPRPFPAPYRCPHTQTRRATSIGKPWQTSTPKTPKHTRAEDKLPKGRIWHQGLCKVKWKEAAWHLTALRPPPLPAPRSTGVWRSDWVSSWNWNRFSSSPSAQGCGVPDTGRKGRRRTFHTRETRTDSQPSRTTVGQGGGAAQGEQNQTWEGAAAFPPLGQSRGRSKTKRLGKLP